MGEVITTQAILPFKYEEEKLKPVGGWINPCFFQEQEHAVQNTNVNRSVHQGLKPFLCAAERRWQVSIHWGLQG